MRRKGGDGLTNIGSDSFLDIIANIVGILIILIVIAGMRVAQQPVLLSTMMSDDEATEADIPVAESAGPVDRSADVALVLTVPDQPEIQEPVEPDPIVIEPTDDLLSKARELEALLARQQALQAELDQRLGSLTQGQSAVDARVDDAEQELNRVTSSLRAAIDDEQQLRGALRQNEGEFERLHQKLVDVQMKEDSNVKSIEHRLNPVGRTVNQSEVHFRVSGDRVGYVPVEELLVRLKSQIERQKGWLTKFPRHEGYVGPVEGFSMKYVVQRQSLNFSDRMRYGSGMMRIAVSEWVLEPEPDAVVETVDQALRNNSRFYRKLQTIDRPAVVTFWVYPDSFESYRKLRDLVHAQGMHVAGRPLPEGVPIAGGPQGSKSSAQ